MIKTKYKKAILLVLMILPVCFTFGGRETYLFSYLPSFLYGEDGGYIFWVLLFCYIFFPFYWSRVGKLFALWVGDFRKSFLIGNIPIFFNVIAEMIYYVVLGLSEEDYPTVAYLIGSHIDKINIFHIFGWENFYWIPFSIILSAFFFLFAFFWGYTPFNKPPKEE